MNPYARPFQIRNAALSLLLLLPTLLHAQSAPSAIGKPPVAASKPVVDDYFGTKVTDPYRWMEAGSSDPALLDYLKAQNDYTKSVLAPLAIPRNKLLARLREIDNGVPLVNSPTRAGSWLFFLRTDPGARAGSLMVRDSKGAIRTLLDPERFSAKGVHAAIDYFVPSPDGVRVVVGASLGGSENSTIHVVETATGLLLPDAITRTQYASPSWRDDGESFYYARLQALPPNAPATALYENEKTFLHVLGTDPEKDPAVLGTGVSSKLDLPVAGFTAVFTAPLSPFVIGLATAGTTDPGEFYLAPAASASGPATPWQKIVPREAQVSTLESPLVLKGSTLYLVVQKDAPNRRLIALDLKRPDINTARVLIPESDVIVENIYGAQDALYVTERSAGKFRLVRVNYDGPANPREIRLPYDGTIASVDAQERKRGVLFALGAWTKAKTLFAYDPATNQSTDTGIMPPDPAENPRIEAREVMIPSTDSTQVPLSIVCRKDIRLNGSNPTILQGYGAYADSIDPAFDTRTIVWVERGGVMAFVHARGGGELGEKWHLAGQKATKQHTIDDMVAAARYLIEQKYSSPDHLAPLGTSAGGITVGGAIVQHPELFAAAVDNVGDTDSLRSQYTEGGAANVPEFGNIHVKEDFPFIYAMSAYEHIVPGTKYPAVFGITGVNDPRVPSWEIAKFISALQVATSGARPIVMRVDFDAGHGLGSSRTQREETFADAWSFLLWQLGDPEFQPAK
jgi:prolyl oligopeptidase